MPSKRKNAKKGKPDGGTTPYIRTVSDNRRARFDYDLLERIEAGLVLAGTEIKSYKTRSTLFTIEERERLRKQHERKGGAASVPNSRIVRAPKTPLDKTARWARDATMWSAFIPLNAQVGGMFGRNSGYGGKVKFGVGGKSLKEIEEAHGAWKHVGHGRALTEEMGRLLMRNEKLKLEYTMDDLRHGRPRSQ